MSMACQALDGIAPFAFESPEKFVGKKHKITLTVGSFCKMPTISLLVKKNTNETK